MRHKTSNYTFSHDYGNINQGPIASYSRTGNTLDHGRIILIMVFVEKCVPRSRMRRLLFERTAPRRSALKIHGTLPSNSRRAGTLNSPGG